MVSGDSKYSDGAFRGTITDKEWKREYGFFTPGEIFFVTELSNISNYSEACANRPKNHEASAETKIVVPVAVNRGTIIETSVPV